MVAALLDSSCSITLWAGALRVIVSPGGFAINRIYHAGIRDADQESEWV